MSVTSEAVEVLVGALSAHPSLTTRRVRFGPIAEARFHEISPGILTWDWRDRTPEERDLADRLAYYDLDDQVVVIGVAVVENEATEIELWRGDGKPILSVPRVDDLWEMEPGRAYSSRT